MSVISGTFPKFFIIFAADMPRITKKIARTLSFRLSLMVIAALATLLLVALAIIFVFSRKAVKEETLQNASQTLEATVQHIDNVLLSVEQASGNIYWKTLVRLDQPDKWQPYFRKLVETNPYITDCRIVWNTDSDAIKVDFPGWLTLPEAQRTPGAITTYCVPVYKGRQIVGTMAVDVSLPLLSKIILEAKPSPNAFCTLLGKDGTIIVHHDSLVLNQNIMVLSKNDDPSMREAAQAMLNGETGYRYVNLDGEDYYVFFKPFERSAVVGRALTNLGWSVGVILPEEDIFGDYWRLHYIVLIIAAVGLLLLLLSCRLFIRRQLIPLRQLEKSARHITEGRYDERIPDSRRLDEVGRLHSHFQQMQQSLATRVGEMQQLSDILKERGEVLRATYEQTRAADRLKTKFLYNMSDQMMAPAEGIAKSAITMSDHCRELDEEDIDRLVGDIQLRGDKVTALLNQLIEKCAT